jgi:hypothetical protein
MLPLIGVGIGVAGAIGQMFGRGKANGQMGRLMKSNPTYQENPLAKQRLGMAQQLLNARMAGAAKLENNIFANQANRVSGLQKSATDATQLLMGGAQSQSQTNDALFNLGIMEDQNFDNRLNRVEGAQQGVINEQDKVFQDQVRRFQDNMQIQGAMNANRQNNWGTLSNMGFGLASFGMQGGFDGMFSGNAAADKQFNSMPMATRTNYIQRP